MRYSQFEADAHNTLGQIITDESEESASSRIAVVHFENN